jgi:23S rRNA pseudouridine1911/1915/1917 synthase
MPVHPSENHFSDTLSNGIKYYFESINLNKKIRPINRLDKNTSGICIFAKNEYIQSSLIKQMQSENFHKKYLAVLTGILSQKNGTISAPIARKANTIMEREVNFENGKKAITDFKVIKEAQNYSLVEFELHTGRTHQIRVHSKFIGHPILGDSLYSDSSELINRQALHAYQISFIHPISKKEIFIEAKLPNDISILF